MFAHIRRTASAVAAILAAGALPAAAQMVLTSEDIADGEVLAADQVFDGFGCTGGNLSPALAWSGAPEGTGGYILTAYDPDAPTGSGWWHWAVANIPAGVTSLPEGVATLPAGAVQARNDFSQNAFGGACPPEGAAPHRYVFTIHAMPSADLPIDAESSGALVGFFAQAGALDSASITALYGR